MSRMLSVPPGRVIAFGQSVLSPPLFNPHSAGSHRERDHCMLVAPMWFLCFGDGAFVAFPATSARCLNISPRLGNPTLGESSHDVTAGFLRRQQKQFTQLAENRYIL